MERRTLFVGLPDWQELPTEPLQINMGPSHPAMHGTVRVLITVEGETVVDADVEVGYLHRCFEKECEAATWSQIFPYCDRLNYASPMLNSIGYALTVEKLLDVRELIPLRAQYLRVITGELSRITDHLTCNGASAMELGAFTPFLWFMKARDYIYSALEELCGARLTYSWIRIGGVASDLPAGWVERMRGILREVGRALDDAARLLVDNRIFRDRMEGVGVISAKRALSYAFTGPQLRSTGVAADVRKDAPYLVYDRMDFTVPVGTRGDCYDRFMVRMEEMRQSMRIVAQALDQLPPGRILLDDPAITLPPKQEVYNSIEGMIRHFKVIFDGIKVPPGEAYGYTEAGNGELGFYIVADGSGRPWKCRCRGPSFVMISALAEMIRGGGIADVVPTFGMQNYIGGEGDR